MDIDFDTDKFNYTKEKCKFIAMMCLLTADERSGFEICERIIGKYFNKPISVILVRCGGKVKYFEFINNERKEFELSKYPKIADEVFKEIQKLQINADSLFIKQAIAHYIKFYD